MKNKNIFSSIVLSWLVAIGLYIALIIRAGGWDILANSRLLSLLMEGGIIRHHDNQIGFIDGLPDQTLYVAANQGIDWSLIWIAIGAFILAWILKAAQLNVITNKLGLKRNFAESWQTFIRGTNYEKFWPYSFGNAALVANLNVNDKELPKAYGAAFLQQLFLIFAIIFFVTISFFIMPWRIWFAQGFIALLILGIAYYWGVRPQMKNNPEGKFSFWKAVNEYLQMLLNDPKVLFKLLVFAILAFALKPYAAHIITAGFHSQPHVDLSVNLTVFIMAACAGYAARLIPITPGGIGQFEWAFALAIMFAGYSFTQAATIAILYAFFNYTSFAAVYGITIFSSLLRGGNANAK